MTIEGLTPDQARYWGVIRGAVTEGVGTAEVWQRIRDFEAAQGVSRPAQLFTAVSRMRSLAVEQRTSVRSIAALPDNGFLQNVRIAADLSARDIITRALDPKFFIRYEATVVTNAGEETSWFTLRHNGVLPATKGDVLRMAAGFAAGKNTQYEFMVTGITGALDILAY